MLKGPDLSKWQGIVDFSKLKNEADFVILRSSYGLQSKDAKFFDYVADARRVGLPILGVYHFCYATSIQQAEQEAVNCMDAVEKAGLDKSTILFYDLEYDSITTAAKKGVTIKRDLVNAFTTAFCHKVQQNGYRAGVYFNKDYYRNMYDKTTLEHYVRWLADYQSTPTYECEIQQCSSSYTVAGVNGNVDWNYLWDTDLLAKEGESMSETEFQEKFNAAMENYLKNLRAKEPSAWSKEARDYCIEQGIFGGDGNENYMWNDFLSREQAAQLIYNQHKKNSK